MSCDHKQEVSEWIDEFVNDWGYTEPGHWHYSVQYTVEDIDLHRYKCTQCGLVMYYSSRAREHFEEGKKFDWIEGLK